MTGGTFSESWHRIADARVGLLPTVHVHKQMFRGSDWYVLRDSYSQRFYRITPQAYAFVARLTPKHTVDEIWKNLLESHPDQAPGQEEVSQVLSQLHFANLLYYRSQPDSQAIFKRYSENRRMEIQSKLLGFLYIQIPLWDPNDLMNRMKPLIRAITGGWFVLVWLSVVMLGAKAAIENSNVLLDRSQGLLAVDNLIWLYVCLAFLKSLHEIGHVFMCKRFGGDVHILGVMFMIFTPLLYMDATSSWSFRSRFERALVAGAGVLVELFIAAIGALTWSNTAPGLINSLAFNIMIIGSLSSLFFNGNPLLRFDAYYILSDLIDIPNLYKKASNQWVYFAKRYIIGIKDIKSDACDFREWCWLTGYGLLAFLYRLLIVAGILLFVADRVFFLAVIFFFSLIITFLIVPVKKTFSFLTGPSVQKNRPRAIIASAISLILPLACIAWIPAPYAIKAPGIIEAIQASTIYCNSSGTLTELNVTSGDNLLPNQLILKLTNPELDNDIEIVRQQIIEAEISLNMALGKSLVDIAPIEKRMEVLRKREAELLMRQDQLIVKAPHAGDWIAPKLKERMNNWITRGESLGELIDRSELRFTAVVSQNQADELFGSKGQTAEIRIYGQSDKKLVSNEIFLIPYKRQRLASAALGLLGGGQIAVRSDDRYGQITTEPFYEVRVVLPHDSDLVAMHGMSGALRIPLNNQPILWQVRKAIMQLFQKRYNL